MRTKFWERSRERRFDYDLYSESIRARKLRWPEAYWCCKSDVEYIDEYAERFRNRNRLSGILKFLALALATILLVTAIVLFCWKPGTEFLIRVLVIIVVSLMLIVVEFTLRHIHYNDIEFNLIRTDNRIRALSEIWPAIVDIVYSNMDNDCNSIPPEPKKVLDVDEFSSMGAEKVFDDAISDINIALSFDDKEEADDRSKSFEELFTVPSDEDLKLAEPIRLASADSKSFDKETGELFNVEEPANEEKTTQNDKPVVEEKPAEEPEEFVIEKNLTNEGFSSEEMRLITEITAKLDAFNKRLQEGL